jgi:hypothetical protein
MMNPIQQILVELVFVLVLVLLVLLVLFVELVGIVVVFGLQLPQLMPQQQQENQY